MLLDRKQYAEAFKLFELSRSRAMADLLTSRPLGLGPALERSLFSQLQTLKVQIGAQQEALFNLTSGSDRDQHTNKIVQTESQIAQMQRQYHQLEDRISKEAPKLKQLTAAETVSLESVQRSAAAGAHDVLYYVVLDTGIILWHIDGANVQIKNVFLPRDQLTKKTTTLHDSLVARRNASDAVFDEETSRQLYLYLIEPVLPFVKSSRLIIIPQGELNSLPFQALQSPQNGKYAGELYEISYAPSATVLSTLEKKQNLAGNLLAVADPQIEAASEEVKGIGKLYPGRSKVVDHQALNKSELKALIGDYNVVHLSVHGKFNPKDPLLSYLQFAETPAENGHLTAAEMFGLPLKKNGTVVLSACETGVVESTPGNEVLGMVRSLLYAGAGTLVLSAWEVDAKSTELWMETFYREGRTQSPETAAMLALVAVKSRPEYRHPFFWAPFLLTGK
jgi:CHAT domain-containing protein